MTAVSARIQTTELVAWLLVLAAAIALRVYDLGARVMSHDESIHAFYGYELMRKGTYTHDPTYHGPLLYHLNALVFFFVGATDATARLSSAIAGTALVAVCWLFRPYLGRAGAFGAAALVAVSPALLFYSRQVWMDLHVALFTMLWIYGVFRYLADRGRRWLYLMTGAMVLAFLAKEVAFIFGAIMGAWLVIELLVNRRSDPARAAAAGDLAVLMLALVLPFSSGAAYLALGWNVRDTHARGLVVVGALVAIGGALIWGWLRWRPRLRRVSSRRQRRRRARACRLRRSRARRPHRRRRSRPADCACATGPGAWRCSGASRSCSSPTTSRTCAAASPAASSAASATGSPSTKWRAAASPGSTT